MTAQLYGESVPPPTGHHHPQADPPKASEGEISQVVTSCCLKTAQAALLPLDHRTQSRSHSGLTHVTG